MTRICVRDHSTGESKWIDLEDIQDLSEENGIEELKALIGFEEYDIVDHELPHKGKVTLKECVEYMDAIANFVDGTGIDRALYDQLISDDGIDHASFLAENATIHEYDYGFGGCKSARENLINEYLIDCIDQSDEQIATLVQYFDYEYYWNSMMVYEFDEYHIGNSIFYVSRNQ